MIKLNLDEIYHRGIRGMKWGKRKEPLITYSNVQINNSNKPIEQKTFIMRSGIRSLTQEQISKGRDQVRKIGPTMKKKKKKSINKQTLIRAGTAMNQIDKRYIHTTVINSTGQRSVKRLMNPEYQKKR